MQFHELRLTSLTAAAGGSFSALTRLSQKLMRSRVKRQKDPRLWCTVPVLGRGLVEKGDARDDNQLTGFVGADPTVWVGLHARRCR